MFSKKFFEYIHRGAFLFGYNPAAKVDSDSYRRYVYTILTINELLNDYGINIKYKGYVYIVDAIFLLLDQRSLDIRLNDDVYPFIKRKYDLKSIALVEHNIRNAIKTAYLRCHNGPVKSRMIEHNKKPTNKQFLLTLFQELTNKMCSDFLFMND